jgi:predicted carbohydrate-binding protein with CBM5 and CBM33 domain
MAVRSTLHTRARIAASVAAVTVAVTMTSLAPAPALAHGAMDSPVSRAMACSSQFPRNATSPACKAAIAVSGASAMEGWDNVRIANVDGRDRQMIPDGKLCSAGLTQYKGLDLARSDWPATALHPGATVTFSYRETIAHRGTFRLYITRTSYDPTKPLTWADLESTPFLTATDPPLKGREYVMPGKVPANKTGRHLIYTIWQTSSTPDTYYTCSDVVLAAPASPATASAQPGATGKPAPTGASGAAGHPDSLVPADALPASDSTSAAGRGSGALLFTVTGLAVLALAAAVVVWRRRLAMTSPRISPRRPPRSPRS